MKKKLNFKQILIILFVLTFIISASDTIGYINILFGLFSMLIISSISVYIHEIGHYFVARLFGYIPKYFIVGTKIVMLNKFNGLFKFKLFGTNFIINPFGQAGSVETFTYIYKGNKFKMAIIAASGALANLLFTLIIFWINSDFLLMQYSKGIEGLFDIFSKTSYESYLFAIFIIIFFVNGFYCFVNLAPVIKKVDGWFILQLLKKDKNPDFYNIYIHREMEKFMVDKNSFIKIIEPIYVKYSEK
ncbi:M50 family metallopeptidase [Aliarcobacter butzleri]|uniref:M50 family metallopeptidase n=1 Tax=Aliarcobacter butzleri TaxID=28197 RepID=UPI002B241148|nr:M50 family metallopeptidase [Aliarcobacter butzleri]